MGLLLLFLTTNYTASLLQKAMQSISNLKPVSMLNKWHNSGMSSNKVDHLFQFLKKEEKKKQVILLT